MGLKEEIQQAIQNANEAVKNSKKLREEANQEFQKILGDRYSKIVDNKGKK